MVETPMGAEPGQLPFDRNAALKRDMNRLQEMAKRLQAQFAALIATLKNTPAGDGQPVLNPARWAEYQMRLDAELRELGLEP
jgi:hypothetical protein